MSKEKVIGIAALVMLACAAGGYYYIREHSAIRAPISVSPKVSEPPASEPGPQGAAPPERAPSPVPAAHEGGEPAVYAGIPLRSGEVLEYTANVADLTNVATLKLVVGAHKDYFGKNGWHLQAFADTQNPLRMVFQLDDQFDSYSEASDMVSLQYEMHLNERGQKIDSVQRMTDTAREPAPHHVAEVRVLPGTRDPLGMLEYLRNVDWAKTAEVQCPVYDGRKLYEVRAKIVGTGEAVAVPAGTYKASKIEIHVFENGQEMTDAHFTMYLANNGARTPVMLEAVMPFATAQVELVSGK